MKGSLSPHANVGAGVALMERKVPLQNPFIMCIWKDGEPLFLCGNASIICIERFIASRGTDQIFLAYRVRTLELLLLCFTKRSCH